MLRLLKQRDGYSCGACAYSCLMSAFGVYLSEPEAMKEVKTGDGTISIDVVEALNKRGIENSGIVPIHTDLEVYYRWLYLNSFNRYLYVHFHGENKGKRGRPTVDHHAVIVHNGLIYDSNKSQPMPLETYYADYNHKLRVVSMIMVDAPNFKRYDDSV